MTQPSGLPVGALKFDTVGTHDFTDSSTWVISPSDSTWKLQPEDGQAMRLIEAQIDFSMDLLLPPSGQEMYVKFWIKGDPNDICVKTITYANMKDWMSRASEKKIIEYSGPPGGLITGNILQLNIVFSDPPELWCSV